MKVPISHLGGFVGSYHQGPFAGLPTCFLATLPLSAKLCHKRETQAASCEVAQVWRGRASPLCHDQAGGWGLQGTSSAWCLCSVGLWALRWFSPLGTHLTRVCEHLLSWGHQDELAKVPALGGLQAGAVGVEIDLNQ